MDEVTVKRVSNTITAEQAIEEIKHILYTEENAFRALARILGVINSVE